MSTADFIERRRPRSQLDNEYALLTEAVGALKARGAGRTRAQLTVNNEFIVECWRQRPNDEGDLPLQSRGACAGSEPKPMTGRITRAATSPNPDRQWVASEIKFPVHLLLLSDTSAVPPVIRLAQMCYRRGILHEPDRRSSALAVAARDVKGKAVELVDEVDEGAFFGSVIIHYRLFAGLVR
jgi:hypothetical protein